MLTWTLDAHAEPSADSWAAMVPPVVESLPVSDVRAAVLAALQAGPLTAAQIELATGLPRERIRGSLWSMANRGLVSARGMGRGSTWSLA